MHSSYFPHLHRLLPVALGWALFAEPLAANPETEASAEELAITFHVATQGNDANPGTREQPFATIARARDAVRPMLAGMERDLVVEVAPGDYFLDETIKLGPDDSGANGHRVIYRGAGEPGSARLVGGVRVLDWEAVGEGRFRTTLPDGISAESVFENGVRARRARFPNYEFDARFPMSDAKYLTSESGTSDSLTWKPGDLDAISDVVLTEGANLVVWPWGFADWHKTPRQIVAVDSETRTIRIEDIKTSIDQEARYFIEGALGLLDAPGEFYFDRATRELTYWPRFGDPNQQEVIVPTLDEIFAFEGRSVDNPVRNVSIEGFSLAFTDTFPAMEGTTMFPWSETSDGAHGMIYLRYTEGIELLRNHLKGAGTNGVYLAQSNKNDRIADNWIEDCGISAIVLAYHRKFRQLPNDINENNVIENNLIERIGSVAVDSAGITIWGGRNNVVRHCEVRDGARYGLSMRGPYTQLRPGDGETEMRSTNRPIAEKNRITHSRFVRVGQDSGDTGAIHMAGISSRSDHPVNTLEQLIIDDIAAHPSMKDASPNGIFFDYTEGVTDQVLRDIEVTNTPNPFRTNRTDVRHTYDNVSWRDDFDTAQMDRDTIGLTKSFPENFGAPSEVINPSVTQSQSAEKGKLEVLWEIPDSSAPPERVWITFEGAPELEPIHVPGDHGNVTIPKPTAGELVMLRIQTDDAVGNRSSGVLIPAAEVPKPVDHLVASGTSGAVELNWKFDGGAITGFEVVAMDRNMKPVRVPAETNSAQITGLKDGEPITLRVDVVDSDGIAWPGTEVRAVPGEGVPVPTDEIASWRFNERDLKEGLSIGDESGNGNTLFVTGTGVKSVEGVDGGAFELDGATGYLRLLDGTGLAPGLGDYSISLWIRSNPSTRMAGRILDFGGGSRGDWEHWGVAAESASPGGGLALVSGDYTLGAVFNDGQESYQVQAKGLSLPDQWHHVSVTVKRNGVMSLWLDGERLDSVRIADAEDRDIQPRESLLIGRAATPDHPNLHWTGAVDELKIYPRALDQDEIIALSKTPPDRSSSPAL